MICAYCKSKLIWNSDFNYDEVYGEGEGVVSFYSCTGCNATAQFAVRTDEDEE